MIPMPMARFKTSFFLNLQVTNQQTAKDLIKKYATRNSNILVAPKKINISCQSVVKSNLSMTHISAAWHAPYRAQQAFGTNLVSWHLKSQVQPHKHKRECGVRCLSKLSVQDRCDSRCVQMVLAPELQIKLDHQLIALSLFPQQQVAGPTSASKIFSQIKKFLSRALIS